MEGTGASKSALCLGATLAVAAVAGTARAQSPSPWPEISLAGLWAQDGAGKGKVLEKPNDLALGLHGSQGDVFQAKPVEVRAGEYKEEAPVGEYDQPQWTTFRRFPLTRVYLQTPPGGAQFEQWFEFRTDKHGGSTDETRLRQELEFGLGHGLQLDMYLRESHFDLTGYSAEIRWAPWNWDEVWGNPTLYFEYIFKDQDHDGIEPKLLLGGELAPGWHWGANFIYERTLAGYDQRTEEESVTYSISHTIVDGVFSAGATAAFNYESGPDSPLRERTHELYLGPSFQLIPTPRASIDLEPVWGLTGESHRYKIFLVFSWHL